MEYQLAKAHGLLLDDKQLERLTVKKDIEARLLGYRIYIVRQSAVTKSD